MELAHAWDAQTLRGEARPDLLKPGTYLPGVVHGSTGYLVWAQLWKGKMGEWLLTYRKLSPLPTPKSRSR